jgi:hypothetical protein
MADIALAKIVYNDEIYFNHDCTLYSIVPLDGYVKWSDHVRDTMPGFTFNHTKFLMESELAVP